MQEEQLDALINSYPMKLENQHQEFIKNIDNWWLNRGLDDNIRVLSYPITNDYSSLILFYYLIYKQTKIEQQSNVLFLVDSNTRKQYLTILARYLRNNICFQNDERLTNIGNTFLAQNGNQIIIKTFQQFIKDELKEKLIFDQVIVQTSNFVRMVKEGFTDYITDTYLRRAYIEALRIQECYRDKHRQHLISKPQKQKKASHIQVEAEVIERLCSDEVKQIKQQDLLKQNMKMDQQYRLPTFGQKEKEVPKQHEVKKIKNTYEAKRESLIRSKKMFKDDTEVFFQQNELVLISGIMYLIGFLSQQLQVKKNKSLSDFFTEFVNKSCLTEEYLENFSRYYEQVFKKCPERIYPQIQQTYIYSICQFINRLILYRKVFFDEHNSLFEMKIERFANDKKQSVFQQSSTAMRIVCKQNNILKKLFKKKSYNTLVLQNLACPNQFWHYVMKKNNLLINPLPEKYKFEKIYGLHISKTSTNQDINFAERLRSDAETMKYKGCGVLLHNLSKIVPDGIVVYFNSQQSFDYFNKQMNSDDQKIMKRIDNNKKIYYESIFQQQNNINYMKYKKSCEIGRGGIFFLVATSKTAQYLKFYKHLSRCIVFFGLPKKDNESKPMQIFHEGQSEERETQLHLQDNLQRINIFNECINNCVNDFNEYRSIIFVGKQISNDLQDWYSSFIRSWGEGTQDSMDLLRNHFQKMGRKK